MEMDVPEVFGAEPPRLLYHYTSATGVLGIIQSGSVWASVVNSLNDAKEFHHAADVLQHCFENWLRQRGNKDQAAFRQAAESLTSHSHRYTGICICSFSAEGDLLSQWRAYGANGRGISLGLNSHLLKVDAGQSGYLLGRCIYDYQAQYAICARYLTDVFRRFPIDARNPQISEEIAEDVGYFLQRLGIFLKHPAFRDESEWRLVSGKNHLYSADWKYRALANGLSAYMELRLPSVFCRETEDAGHPGVPHFQFTLGPLARRDATGQILQALSFRVLGKGYGYHSSSAPFVD